MAKKTKISNLPPAHKVVDSRDKEFRKLLQEVRGTSGREATQIQMSVPVYSTGCLPVDWGIGRRDPVYGNGGIPRHSCIEAYGSTGVGKSTLMVQHFAQIHARDPEAWVAIYFSEEPWLDVVWAAGLDPDRTIIIEAWNAKKDLDAKYKFAEQRFEDLITALEHPLVAAGGIDSVKAAISVSQVYEKGDLKKRALRGFEKSDPVARRAQLMEKFFNDYKTIDSDATIFMTNQASEIIEDPTKPPEFGAKVRRKTPAGRRKEFEAFLRVELSSKPLEPEGDNAKHDLFNFRPAYGLDVHFKIWKNRYSPLQGYRQVQSDFLFDICRFDSAADVLKCGVRVGIIKRRGNYYDFPVRGKDGEKVCVLGKANAEAFLYQNPKLLWKLNCEIAKRHRDLFSLNSEKSEKLKAAYALFKPYRES